MNSVFTKWLRPTDAGQKYAIFALDSLNLHRAPVSLLGAKGNVDRAKQRTEVEGILVPDLPLSHAYGIGNKVVGRTCPLGDRHFLFIFCRFSSCLFWACCTTKQEIMLTQPT